MGGNGEVCEAAAGAGGSGSCRGVGHGQGSAEKGGGGGEEKKKRKKALPAFAEITTASEENHRAAFLMFSNKATQYTELKTDTSI